MCLVHLHHPIACPCKNLSCPRANRPLERKELRSGRGHFVAGAAMLSHDHTPFSLPCDTFFKGGKIHMDAFLNPGTGHEGMMIALVTNCSRLDGSVQFRHLEGVEYTSELCVKCKEECPQDEWPAHLATYHQQERQKRRSKPHLPKDAQSRTRGQGQQSQGQHRSSSSSQSQSQKGGSVAGPSRAAHRASPAFPPGLSRAPEQSYAQQQQQFAGIGAGAGTTPGILPMLPLRLTRSPSQTSLLSQSSQLTAIHEPSSYAEGSGGSAQRESKGKGKERATEPEREEEERGRESRRSNKDYKPRESASRSRFEMYSSMFSSVTRRSKDKGKGKEKEKEKERRR